MGSQGRVEDGGHLSCMLSKNSKLKLSILLAYLNDFDDKENTMLCLKVFANLNLIFADFHGFFGKRNFKETYFHSRRNMKNFASIQYLFSYFENFDF